MTHDFNNFLSPFSWRYGSPEMRAIFSEKYKRTQWRKIWYTLALSQYEYGLISKSELNNIKKFSSSSSVNIKRSLAIEKKIRHDLMSEIKTFAAQAKKGGGKIHLGATSMDIEDNADMLIIREALLIILEKTVDCLALLSEKIKSYSNTVCMGWTHIQPAEPTTLGYRFSLYAQDLFLDIKNTEFILENFAFGKGIKGAVGTSASYQRLLGKNPQNLENTVMKRLDIKSFLISSQTYPRKVDFLILSALSSIAQSLHKFSIDFRILQSPPFGEFKEPTKKHQVGSSAMPFKRNPIMSERISSLTRYISSFLSVAHSNASNSILERTLDDSANRRIIIPESFLALDECLIIYSKILSGMEISKININKNLNAYGPFALIEPIMMDLSKQGRNRQSLHEEFRKISLKAWAEVELGHPNPLFELISKNKNLPEFSFDMKNLSDYSKYIGNAPERSLLLRKSISPILKKYKNRPKRISGPSY